jgi:hypothetical protein
MRVLRLSVGANLIFSALLVLAWLGYAAWRGWPIDQHCFGFKHGWRMPAGPAWVTPALIESLCIALFFLPSFASKRKLGLVMAGFSVWCLLFGVLVPVLKQQAYGIPFFTPEQPIWWYACVSNIACGLLMAAESTSGASQRGDFFT